MQYEVALQELKGYEITSSELHSKNTMRQIIVIVRVHHR